MPPGLQFGQMQAKMPLSSGATDQPGSIANIGLAYIRNWLGAVHAGLCMAVQRLRMWAIFPSS